MLSFFFDGVPAPGTSRSDGAADGTAAFADQSPDESGPDRARGRIMYAHAPYGDRRCHDCHDPDNGLLYKTAEDGLCQICHPDVPGPVGYVHGPVALNDCLICHHPHESEHRPLLRGDPTAVCFRCHKPTDPTEGSHHDAAEDSSCSDCHDPHGGSDRFFLK